MNQGPFVGPGGGGAGQGQGRPGQMTAVMRAMAQATGPKVLRIGLVQGGRVIEERVIKQRTTVTVGASEKAMFVIPSNVVPAQYKLFELVGNDYHLNFLDGMSGRVALATGITDIAALKGQAKRVGNGYQVKLTEEARGKIVVGETTFLFQFVAPPPVQPRPQLPLAVKGGLANQIDWNLTIIAAFSFMLHFGLIGAMYSDWMDPIVNDDINIQGLIDLTKNLPTPPIEDKAPVDDKANDKKEAEAAKPAAPSGGKSAAKGGGPKTSDAQAAKLAAAAEALQVGILAAFNGNSAVQGALSRSDIPPVDLSGAAASGAAVSAAGGDLHLGGGGGIVQPGRSGGLGGIAGSQGSGAGSGSGTLAPVQGPKGDASIGATSATVPVSNAERVIAGLRPKFRLCYNQGLAQDPGMSGSVAMTVKIAPNGEVNSADAASNSGLSDSVVKCIARALKNAQFDAPGSSGSTLSVPVKFIQQGK
ncbi:MAG TPA: AgmX/PglI C-terminal domain-containing protein [Polyangiaceae bacterium]